MMEIKSIELIKFSYYELVRSQLEYCTEVCSPIYQVHVKLIRKGTNENDQYYVLQTKHTIGNHST